MKPARGLYSKGIFLALAVCLLLSGQCSRAQEPLLKPSHSTNPVDRAACERQLNMIYGAIQEYRKQHDGTLPAKLSDLTPDFVHDPNVLICPFVQKRGGLRSWKKRFRELSPDPHTSYGFEFPPAPLDEYLWRGVPKKTWREFKERAAQELGPVVPIVRCHDHRPTLNLAVGGRIYESGDYWEHNFTTNDHLLTVSKLFASSSSAPGLADFPPRDPRAGARLIDLTGYYNATLTNSWQGFPGNNLANLQAGVQELGGVRFDVRGVIQLQGTELPAEFPKRVAGIKVNQNCSRIHFLHAVSTSVKSGTTGGVYIVHYISSVPREFPLVYGLQIADWWRDPQNAAAPTNAKAAWTGENEAAKAYDKSICLYHAIWENPWPDIEVATITFDAGNRKYPAGPFVVAITLE